MKKYCQYQPYFWAVLQQPFVWIVASLIAFITLYLCELSPRISQWQTSQQQLKHTQQSIAELNQRWLQCQQPLEDRVAPSLRWFYQRLLTHQTHAHPSQAINQYLQKHNIVVTDFSQRHINQTKKNQLNYQVCGKFNDLVTVLNHWHRDKFLAWIEAIDIRQCPDRPQQLQLTLSLENAIETPT